MYIPYLWRNVDITEIMPCTVHVTLSPCCRMRDMPRVYPYRNVATQFAIFESDGLQHLGYPSREGLPFTIHDMKELKECLLSEWRLLDHTIITTAIAQWRSRLNACVCVIGGHFEHKFWASNFLLCFVCFIDTSSPKCDRYKYVQSANIVSCVSFVSETFTCYPYAYPFHLCF